MITTAMASMILGGLGTAAGLGTTYLGYRKAGEEAKKQQALIDEQERRLENYYDRNYYGDYFNTAEAQNAMRRVRETLQRRNEDARGRAVVNGTTNEAILAQQEQDNKVLADTAGNLAEQSTAIKRDADKTYLNGMAQVGAQNANLSQHRMAGYQQLAANGANVMQGGLQTLASGLASKQDGLHLTQEQAQKALDANYPLPTVKEMRENVGIKTDGAAAKVAKPTMTDADGVMQSPTEGENAAARVLRGY